MSCWEKIEGAGHGTGVVMAPGRVGEMREFTDPGSTQQHALLITNTDAGGKVRHWAGFGWEKGGEITTSEKWEEYLSRFSAALNTKK